MRTSLKAVGGLEFLCIILHMRNFGFNDSMIILWTVFGRSLSDGSGSLLDEESLLFGKSNRLVKQISFPLFPKANE